MKGNLTTAEVMARFVRELEEAGFSDETIDGSFGIALAEHCRMQGGPLVNADREWQELD